LTSSPTCIAIIPVGLLSVPDLFIFAEVFESLEDFSSKAFNFLSI